MALLMASLEKKIGPFSEHLDSYEKLEGHEEPREAKEELKFEKGNSSN